MSVTKGRCLSFIESKEQVTIELDLIFVTKKKERLCIPLTEKSGRVCAKPLRLEGQSVYSEQGCNA